MKYNKHCKNTEVYIKNYQDEKLNTSIDHDKRMAMHKNVLQQIHVSKKFEQDYKDFIASANDRIKDYQIKLSQVKDKLISMENERCQNIHEAVGGFVVFEKNAEMNNKYDVGNFAKLLETFDAEKEDQLVQKYLNEEHIPQIG